jgi:dipeptidyl aminopeptidase/acylaminoacyl peptidase
VAFYELNPDTGRDIWLRAGENEQPRVFQRSRFNERSPRFSPKGHWIAYVSNASGRDEVYVKRVGESGSQQAISDGGGGEPVWSPDGQELFYRSDGWLMAVAVDVSADMLEVGERNALFNGDFKRELVAGNAYYDVASDGKRFLMIEEDAELSRPDRLHVVLGFVNELAQKEPPLR